MAIVHKGASIVPTKTEMVTEWMPRQRWYHGKGHVPQLRRVGGFRFEDPEGEVGCETLLLADEAVEPVRSSTRCRSPTAPRRSRAAEHALLGTMEHSVLGTRWVYDGPHDPVYVGQLVGDDPRRRRLRRGAGVRGQQRRWRPGPRRVSVHGSVSSPTVLSGEQSNTSIICRMTAPGGGPAEPVIVKVFRTLQDGENPDVVVQSALTAEGSDRVPMAIGHLSGAWDAPAGDGSPMHGHLAFAQEFIPGVEDAWRVALVAAASGSDFTARARDLGVVTAQIHGALAHALGTHEVTDEAREALVASMRQRYAAAVALRARRSPPAPPAVDRVVDVGARRELAAPAADPRRLPPRSGARRARAGLGGPRLRGRAAAPARRARTARPHGARRRRDAAIVRLRRGLGGARPSPPSTRPPGRPPAGRPSSTATPPSRARPMPTHGP